MIIHPEFLYLPFIDLVHLNQPLQPGQNIFGIYNAREPGYIKGWLQAYQFALVETAFSSAVTPGLLRGIQERAARHYLDSGQGSKVGYSDCFECFTTMPAQIGRRSFPNYCLTPKGIEDFINYWFVEAPLGRHHTLLLCDGTDTERHIMQLVSYDPDTASFKIKSWPRGLISELSNKALLKQVEKLSVEKPGMVVVQRKPLTKEVIENRLELLCRKFNQHMAQEQNPLNRKKLIINFVRRLNQFHPFIDANTRTCYVIMNILFMRYNLSPSLLINPNWLDLCTLDEVTAMVDQGVVYFRQFAEVITAKGAPISIVFAKQNGSHNMQRLEAKPIRFPAMAGAACIVRHMLIAAQAATLRAPPLINSALEASKPSLAFRRACTAKTSKWALWLINQSARSIDFIETTSLGKTGADLVTSNSKMPEDEKAYLLSVIHQATICSETRKKRQGQQAKVSPRLLPCPDPGGGSKEDADKNKEGTRPDVSPKIS
jgi:hypothetical protein